MPKKFDQDAKDRDVRRLHPQGSTISKRYTTLRDAT